MLWELLGRKTGVGRAGTLPSKWLMGVGAPRGEQAIKVRLGTQTRPGSSGGGAHSPAGKGLSCTTERKPRTVPYSESRGPGARTRGASQRALAAGAKTRRSAGPRALQPAAPAPGRVRLLNQLCSSVWVSIRFSFQGHAASRQCTFGPVCTFSFTRLSNRKTEITTPICK